MPHLVKIEVSATSFECSVHRAPPVLGARIGKGALGDVYRATWAGEAVAVKAINKRWEQALPSAVPTYRPYAMPTYRPYAMPIGHTPCLPIGHTPCL